MTTALVAGAVLAAIAALCAGSVNYAHHFIGDVAGDED